MQVVMQDSSVPGFMLVSVTVIKVANRGICQLLEVLCTFALAYERI